MSIDCDEHTFYMDQGKKNLTVRINVATGWFSSAKGKPGEEIQGYAPDHFWVGIYEDHERGASNYLYYQYADAQTHERHGKGKTVGKCAINITDLEKKGVLERGKGYVVKLCSGSFVKSVICTDPEQVKITTIAHEIQRGIKKGLDSPPMSPQIVNVTDPGSATKLAALDNARQEIFQLKVELKALKKENATLKRKAHTSSDDDADDTDGAADGASVTDQARKEMKEKLGRMATANGSAKKKRKKGG